MGGITIKIGSIINIEEIIYITASNMNVLLRVDNNTNTLTKILHFDGYESWFKNMHSKIERYNNKLFFFPKKSKGIHIYDIKNNQQKYIQFDPKYVNREIFYEPYRLGDKVWLFSVNITDTVISFDMGSEEITYEVGVMDGIRSLVCANDKRTYLGDAVDKDKIYIGLKNTNSILEVDTRCRMVKKINLEDSIKINSIIVYEGDIWLTSLGRDCIYTYNIENKDTKKYECLNENAKFGRIIIRDRGKYVFDVNCRCIYKISENKQINKYIEVEEEMSCVSIDEKKHMAFCYYDNCDNIYYGMGDIKNIYKYITRINKIEKLELNIDSIKECIFNVLKEKIILSYREKNIVVEEYGDIELCTMIEENKKDKCSYEEWDNIGSIVYNIVKADV